MKNGIITEVRLPNYGFDGMSNLGFSGLPQKLISNHFFLKLLVLIICYETMNKRFQEYYDHHCICRIMVSQISQKCQFFRFLEAITISSFSLTTNLKYKALKVSYATFALIIKVIWSFSKAENVSFGLSIERSFYRFWPISLNFESDYLDDKKR